MADAAEFDNVVDDSLDHLSSNDYQNIAEEFDCGWSDPENSQHLLPNMSNIGQQCITNSNTTTTTTINDSATILADKPLYIKVQEQLNNWRLITNNEFVLNSI